MLCSCCAAYSFSSRYSSIAIFATPFLVTAHSLTTPLFGKFCFRTFSTGDAAWPTSLLIIAHFACINKYKGGTSFTKGSTNSCDCKETFLAIYIQYVPILLIIYLHLIDFACSKEAYFSLLFSFHFVYFTLIFYISHTER